MRSLRKKIAMVAYRALAGEPWVPPASNVAALDVMVLISAAERVHRTFGFHDGQPNDQQEWLDLQAAVSTIKATQGVGTRRLFRR